MHQFFSQEVALCRSDDNGPEIQERESQEQPQWASDGSHDGHEVEENVLLQFLSLIQEVIKSS